MGRESYDIPLRGPLVVEFDNGERILEMLASDLFVIDGDDIPQDRHVVAFVESGWHNGGTLPRLMRGEVQRLGASWYAIGDRYSIRPLGARPVDPDRRRAWKEMEAEIVAGRGTREDAAQMVKADLSIPRAPE